MLSVLSLGVPVVHPDGSTHALAAASGKCNKWLWFAGLGEPTCGKKRFVYYQDYAVTLTSAQKNAPALQPVLLLGQFNHKFTSDKEALEDQTNARAQVDTPYKVWIESLGGKVVVVRQLTFHMALLHSQLNKKCRGCFGPEGEAPDLAGVFLRLHVPQAIEDHNLFHMPGVCSDNVLYTDSDTYWMPTTADDLRGPMEFFASHPGIAVRYSTEEFRNQHVPSNTGVMFMNIPEWNKRWPGMLGFGHGHGFDFPQYDQSWINQYYGLHGGRSYLDEHWNWKVYWGNDTNRAPHVVHFHGPKPGKGRFLECLASMDATCLQWPDLGNGGSDGGSSDGAYKHLIQKGFAADHGAFANVTMENYGKIFKSLQPKIDEFYWTPDSPSPAIMCSGTDGSNLPCAPCFAHTLLPRPRQVEHRLARGLRVSRCAYRMREGRGG